MLLRRGEDERRVPHMWKPPYKQEDQLRQKRSSAEDAAASLGQAGQIETYTDGLSHSPVSPV